MKFKAIIDFNFADFTLPAEKLEEVAETAYEDFVSFAEECMDFEYLEKFTLSFEEDKEFSYDIEKDKNEE